MLILFGGAAAHNGLPVLAHLDGLLVLVLQEVRDGLGQVELAGLARLHGRGGDAAADGPAAQVRQGKRLGCKEDILFSTSCSRDFPEKKPSK